MQWLFPSPALRKGCRSGKFRKLMHSVKALARRRENGKQRRKWCRSLSRLEFACSEISLPRTQNHCLWARNDGYRSGNRRLKGRLLARNLYLEHQPLSDELLTNLDQVPRSRSNRSRQFSRDLTQTLH